MSGWSKRTTVTMADWAKLPDELLSLICKKITVVADYFSFRGVCRSWRDIAFSDGNVLISPPPWLMLPEPKHINKHIKENLDEDTEIIPRCSFIGLFEEENKIYELDLPEVYLKKRFGSLGNWIVIRDNEWTFQLLNPFTRILIDLPQFKQSIYDDFRDNDGSARSVDDDRFFVKVVLSATPMQENPRACVAMGVTSCTNTGYELCFARPGDESWTAIPRFRHVNEEIYDAIFFEGRFYAITYILSYCFLFSCDIDGSYSPKAKIVMHISEEDFTENIHCYLVEWSGRLLLVVMIYKEEDSSDDNEDSDDEKEKNIVSTSVKEYKLDLTNRTKEKVKDLGPYCLFLGTNTSVSVLASNSSPWRRNCIYFTDEDHECWSGTTSPDVGYKVFDFENGSIESNYTEYFNHTSSSLWIIPKSLINIITD